VAAAITDSSVASVRGISAVSPPPGDALHHEQILLEGVPQAAPGAVFRSPMANGTNRARLPLSNQHGAFRCTGPA
ncbi:hypothetical protein ABZT43_46915, partial [Streptomyces sp. NPDC005349]|uniref:hypothetical protein n=1 Tax=Streptomyces sp. NPDC005349 TaxID=3157037 RepID=UPI00339E676D